MKCKMGGKTSQICFFAYNYVSKVSVVSGVKIFSKSKSKYKAKRKKIILFLRGGKQQWVGIFRTKCCS